MDKYKRLAVNAGLSFVAGFATSFGVFIAATPKDPGKAALLAAAGAAVYAGFRALVGVVAAAARDGELLPVDKPPEV